MHLNDVWIMHLNDLKMLATGCQCNSCHIQALDEYLWWFWNGKRFNIEWLYYCWGDPNQCSCAKLARWLKSQFFSLFCFVWNSIVALLLSKVVKIRMVSHHRLLRSLALFQMKPVRSSRWSAVVNQNQHQWLLGIAKRMLFKSRQEWRLSNHPLKKISTNWFLRSR